jgi:ABC-type branched-subunit amino acid transport system ATPase component
MTSETPILELDRVCLSFGGLQVLRNLSFSLKAGEATALIGPNGAGKTTAFNVISGVYDPTEGRVFLNGKDLAPIPSRYRIRHGLARSFQNVRLMPHLSVCENLLVGQHVCASGLRDLLMPFRLFRDHRWRREAIAALAEVGLEAYADEPVSALPYGLRKQVDLVRATLANASILMLDEPAAGLNPTETNALRAHLERLKERGITLFVVEHDMHFIGSVCDHVVVLNFGQRIAEGTLSVVQKNPHVRAAYFGAEEAA